MWAFDSLETTAAIGAGKTMYAGNVALNTDFASGTYALRDTTRGGGGGNYTCDNNNRVDLVIFRRPCPTFTRATNVFGNNMKNSTDRSTAAADAHYGRGHLGLLQEHARPQRHRQRRQGDLQPRPLRSPLQNAFWSDGCFCMTYGDGAATSVRWSSLDIAGHEMTHGVIASEANLIYRGESGGLNESNSDIFGTMVEFPANNARTRRTT